ncbi:hypothetical protein CIN_21100 [Commensalibacter intestini A911]|uniref:Stress-response A/B barrel domain-containing protein n=2 Tax=Commensalibacter intestini TaxID=479936 RepID=A0A251ZSJ9_9PROT|nr:DUF6616 family protein [Commensalibacter intestini]EHD12944.1 hypothetical protein CIN_21100 [Commensalibacter intestini A911]OUI77634.1 hypothetical protein HK18_04975 [Commensalibacter intestini]
MAYVVTQVFSPKDKWKKVARPIKEQILQRMIVNLSSLAGENRVQLIATGQIDSKIPRVVDYEFYVMWSVDIEEVSKHITQNLRESEWNEYFDVVNIGGRALNVPQFAEIVLADLEAE